MEPFKRLNAFDTNQMKNGWSDRSDLRMNKNSFLVKRPICNVLDWSDENVVGVGLGPVTRAITSAT